MLTYCYLLVNMFIFLLYFYLKFSFCSMHLEWLSLKLPAWAKYLWYWCSIRKTSLKRSRDPQVGNWFYLGYALMSRVGSTCLSGFGGICGFRARTRFNTWLPQVLKQPPSLRSSSQIPGLVWSSTGSPPIPGWGLGADLNVN